MKKESKKIIQEGRKCIRWRNERKVKKNEKGNERTKGRGKKGQNVRKKKEHY